MHASPAKAELIQRIIEFLRQIGLTVEPGEVPARTFTPGLTIVHGSLVFDEARLDHPGDLLHEAGHLAVVSPAQRSQYLHDAGADGGDEMTAIAWSYAALLHLGLDPRVVFHAQGYFGGSEAIIENFAAGRTFGVPLLQFHGMAVDQKTARELGLAPYPHMLKWVRD